MSGPTEGAPTVLVVFGATGDLMERKIVPSLYHLAMGGRLPDRFRVIGFARRPFADDVFQGMVADMARRHVSGTVGEDAVQGLSSRFTYSQGQFGDEAAYQSLAGRLAAIDTEWGLCANKLFYLAVPPEWYGTIFERLSMSGLAAGCGGEGGWTRLLVEKPFGKDGAEAQRLDELLGTLFKESQIYRIDHYLAKEMLQGIVAFRFSNNLLEPSWDRRGIERIDIDLLETLDVAGRESFYDALGALRDVGQNHLLQMLALVTMDQPASLEPDDIRAARLAALQALAPPAHGEMRAATFRAQYDRFRDEEGVAPDSGTETFFRIDATLQSRRWHGVPVTLTGGKGLRTARKGICVTFRHPHPCLCEGAHTSNRVTFRLEPDEGISISFWTKRPGFDREMQEQDFDYFVHEDGQRAQYVEEYARLLYDAIAGDQTLFVSTGEVRAMWDFIDPVTRAWAGGDVPLHRYPYGTDDVITAAAAITGAVKVEPRDVAPEIGVVGLGRMGAGLALNLLDHGWRVVGYNRTTAKADALAADGLVVAPTPADLVAALRPPRTVWLMLTAGAAVEELLFGAGGLAGLLSAGDTVIDGGNSYYGDDAARAQRLSETGIGFIDVGTSGGPAGARNGACLMIGGDRDRFASLDRLWRDVSVPDGYRFFPGVGAGHFVKMIHNGIEYGMMQAIAEGFDILRASAYSLDLSDVAAIYDNGSVIESRLTGWLEDAFRIHGPDLDGVTSVVGHTGEGEWTVQVAASLGIRARVIEDAVRFRIESETRPEWSGRVLSALREQFGRHAITTVAEVAQPPREAVSSGER